MAALLVRAGLDRHRTHAEVVPIHDIRALIRDLAGLRKRLHAAVLGRGPFILSRRRFLVRLE